MDKNEQKPESKAAERGARKFDAEAVAGQLPRNPDPAWTIPLLERLRPEMGGNMMIFSRVQAAEAERYDCGFFLQAPEPTRGWAVKCRCTACGDVWYTGWLTKKRGGPGLLCIEDLSDGTIIPGVPESDDSEEVQPYAPGGTIVCPSCGAETTVTPLSEIRRGRLYQTLTFSVEAAGRFSAVVYWMVSRRLGWDDCGVETVSPQAAGVLDDDGKYHMFRWDTKRKTGNPQGGWKPSQCMISPSLALYHSWEANSMRKVGALPAVMDGDTIRKTLMGRTGEKTGLAEYIAAEGDEPLFYLRFWRDNRTVENLLKAGWGRAVVTAIDAEVARLHVMMCAGQGVGRTGGKTLTEEIALIADYAAASPRDMLHMTRTEVRQGKDWAWDCDTLMTWQAFCSPCETMTMYGLYGPGGAARFHEMVLNYGLPNIRRWGEPDSGFAREFSLEEMDRYLRRQMRLCDLFAADAATMFFDYREALYSYGTQAEQESSESLWPNRLRPAHDAMMLRADFKETMDFSAIRHKWKDLEWTDGTYCVRLPRSQTELSFEGQKLHHCVGSYGHQHLSGKVILFVRRYRKPNRPYFTLNEDLTGLKPHRVQLHGYGNEFAHGKRLRIPTSVKEFVARWEQEVLNPVFYQMTAKDKNFSQFEKFGLRERQRVQV